MIEAKDLRIGNLVNKSLRSGNGRTIIDKIGPQDIVRCYENISHFIYTGIPITEEWLLKFGFHMSYGLTGKVFRLGLYFIIGYDGIYYIELGKGMNIEIKYVHQLQNLYFALTQTELIIQ